MAPHQQIHVSVTSFFSELCLCQKVLKIRHLESNFCSNYSDLTRPHPNGGLVWFSKGNPLISEESRLVKYYNLARNLPSYRPGAGFNDATRDEEKLRRTCE